MELQKSKPYRRHECIVFLKTNESFGGLSNMAGGYPLSINGIRILTSEALYQACRFPHMPDIQRLIIGQPSPITAKMKSKPYRKNSRQDWDEIRVQIMDWCLRVKLAQNWEKFSQLLLSTEDKPIVEESYRDPFWGAKPTDAETLVGINVLGQQLTALREQLKAPNADSLRVIEPPAFSQFLLIGKPIGVISCQTPKSGPTAMPLSSKFDSYAQLTLESHTSPNRSNLVQEGEITTQKSHEEAVGSLPSAQISHEHVQPKLPF